MDSKGLIGYSGYVGSTLCRQTSFEHKYRSTNIAEIAGREFDVLVCAGAPAQKWIANRDPATDEARIDGLIDHLRGVRANHFILISTVDVFIRPIGVNEKTAVEYDGLHAYGRNRRRLEEFVQSNFASHLVLRLPGLVGPGLRKNIIFDLLNDNNIHSIDSRSIFQFYPMVNLWSDIQTARSNNIELLHLTAEPISVAEVAAQGFGIEFCNELQNAPANYDIRSIYISSFGGLSNSNYQYSKRDTLLAIRHYAQTEIPSLEKASPKAR